MERTLNRKYKQNNATVYTSGAFIRVLHLLWLSTMYTQTFDQAASVALERLQRPLVTVCIVPDSKCREKKKLIAFIPSVVQVGCLKGPLPSVQARSIELWTCYVDTVPWSVDGLYRGGLNTLNKKAKGRRRWGGVLDLKARYKRVLWGKVFKANKGNLKLGHVSVLAWDCSWACQCQTSTPDW